MSCLGLLNFQVAPCSYEGWHARLIFGWLLSHSCTPGKLTSTSLDGVDDKWEFRVRARGSGAVPRG
jgi:hypothetical protein